MVGGAVRDDLLGRTALDVDVACRDPERAARALVALAGDAVFPLNEEFGAWRVLLDRSRTVDFSPLRGGSIDGDLAARDFTVNAIARPVIGGEYVDRSAAAPTSSAASCGRSRPTYSTTIPSGCCAASGSRASWASGSIRRRRS